MRTTVDVDPDLLERLRVDAARRRMSFKDLLNAVIRAGLGAPAVQRPPPYRPPVFHMGQVREGVDIDRALAAADALEDREVRDELSRRR